MEKLIRGTHLFRLAIMFAFCVVCVRAGKHTVSGDVPIHPYGTGITYGARAAEAIYSSDTALGSTRASVEFDVTFSRDKNHLKEKGDVYFVVYRSDAEDDISTIRSTTSNLPQFCSPDGEVIAKNGVSDLYHAHEVKFEDTTPQTYSTVWTADLLRTGHYVALVLNCDNSVGTLTLSGSINFYSTYGQLPGTAYAMFPFFFSMMLGYLFVAIFWTILCYKYSKDLLKLHYLVFGMLFIGMFEMLIGFLAWSYWNHFGSMPVTVVGLKTLINLLKRSFSRGCVLALAMGYSVVKPTLGTVKYKIIALSVVFFVLGGLQEAVTQANFSDDVSFFLRMILIIPVSAIDSLFFFWTFISLRQTIQKLRIRRQSARLGIYQKWVYIFSTVLAIAVFFMLYQIIIEASTSVDRVWKITWIFDAFWTILYLIILAAIAGIWRPSEDNTRFAFTPDINIDDESEDQFDAEAPFVENTSARLRNVAKESMKDAVEEVSDNLADSLATAPAPETTPTTGAGVQEKGRLVASFIINSDSDDEVEKEEQSKLE